MCGIAGIMTLTGDAPDPILMATLDHALRHRGPDGGGAYQADDVGLVHRRLAIIDLESGGQPLATDNGLVLVANGEIYNDPALRRTLAAFPFKTGSDCEPPLALYPQHGLDFPAKLRGMYAIALHDPQRRRLVLARDPFGIKPLYYAETPIGLIFASEPQAILATGIIARRLDTAARDSLLQLQFTTGAETAFSGIRRLLPGETIAIEAGKIVERRRIGAVPVTDGRLPRSSRRQAADRTVAELDRVLCDSVGAHQRSDVAFGMFLSGGIDSAALLAMMARLNDRPVQAYTASFPGTAVPDESGLARTLARRVGADHIDVPLTADDLWSSLPAIVAAVDDPTADYAIIPTFKLAAVARQSVKVILSGEGGDELFGGYGRYRVAMRPWPFTRRMRRHGRLAGLGLLRDDSDSWRRGYRIAEQAADRAWPGERLRAAQALDCADWLPNDLLIKLDRCLMAHGIEGRVPFLDPAVAAFAFNLPDRQKVHGERGKWLLRCWLDAHLPEAQAFSGKRGFTVPIAEWLANRPELGARLARQQAIQAICRPGSVEALFARLDKRTGHAAWTLLFYALWHRCHIEGAPSSGTVFDALA